MNIRVAAFTVSEKSINIRVHSHTIMTIVLLQCNFRRLIERISPLVSEKHYDRWCCGIAGALDVPMLLQHTYDRLHIKLVFKS